MKTTQKRTCGEYIILRLNARFLWPLPSLVQFPPTMQPVNSLAIPLGLVIGAVVASSIHVIYLLLCLLPLANRLLQLGLADDRVYKLLQRLTYATLKILFDALALAATYSGIHSDWFPVFVGASMAVALIAEVRHIHLPNLLSHRVQARRRQYGRQQTNGVAVIAAWLSPVIRSIFAFGCAYQPQLSAYLWTTLGITMEYIIGCICRKAPSDRNQLAFHLPHILASLSCGTLSMLGIVLTDHRGALLGVGVAPSLRRLMD